MDTTESVILDDGAAGCALEFAHPSRTFCADTAAHVPDALTAMVQARRAGRWLAGYFSYELGYALEPRLRPLLTRPRGMPLLWFGAFDRPTRLDAAAADARWPGSRVYVSPPAFEWDGAAYRERFRRVMAAIEAGDLYEANLSLRARFRVTGDPRALYGQLRRAAQVAHGAFVDDGTRSVLSLSPELFFRLDADGTLTAQPMKGTAPRDADAPRDRVLRDALRDDAKTRAENLMIVDLLRNDLGRIAAPGSVRVPKLFELATYPTLHQMTSTVTARLAAGGDIAHLLGALFPCGSVTGAPKVAAMQLLAALETSPRGAYCGAIGMFAPDASARFNVAIRTMTVQDGMGELGIGGAVVADSDAAAEYAECLLKARFLTAARRPLGLLETLAWKNGDWVRRDRHLARLAASAAALGIACDMAAVRATLAAAVGDGADARVRLRLGDDGEITVTTAHLPAPQATWRCCIAPDVRASGDPLARHKTDWREDFDAALTWARQRGADEALLCNERGEVCEGSFNTVFVRRDGELVTLPLASGVLPGCLRAELLASGRCREAVLYPADLARHPFYLGNSLRGLRPATLLAPAPDA